MPYVNLLFKGFQSNFSNLLPEISLDRCYKLRYSATDWEI
jgi:hypothetical protein